MEGAIRHEMLFTISNCAHLVLPSTSKRIINGFISKRTYHHSKINSDATSRPKR